MKKLFGMLVALVMVLCMIAPSFAAEKVNGQVVAEGGVKYFDMAGKETTNNTFPGGDAVVELSKKIASTEKENEFIVTLEVSTTQKLEELHSDTPDAAVVLIIDVSNSMTDCVECGKEYSEHRQWTGHPYVSRMAKAKEAAIQFLDDFANKTGAQTGDKRYVAIVDFGSTAYRRLNWVDVANPSQMESAKEQIHNLTVAHSDLNNVSDDGGTNIEGALMLAANVWGSNATVADVSYKYTILLTDGNPTYNVSDNANDRTSAQKIVGTAGGRNKTNYADAKDVGTQADRILNLNGISKLYSICFGQGVWEKTPFSDWSDNNHKNAKPRTNKNMTIGQWLTAFSTAAFDGQTSGLFDTFNSVISQIQLAAQAWKVNDTMGKHVVYGGEVQQGTLHNRNSFDEETGELTWNLLQSDHSGFKTVWVHGTEYPVLTYTYKYKITLDNLDESYAPSNSGTPANKEAALTFAVKGADGLWTVLDSVKFPVPAVTGYTGELSFNKVWMDNGTETKLSGAKFTLTSKEKSAEGAVWSQTATSDENGLVKFTGIPSGHTYTLTETDPTDGFAAAASRDVVVSYGTTTCANLTDGKIVNEHTYKTVNLTLNKAFGNENKPASILFTITGPNYRDTVELNADNQWSVTLKGLTPGEYTISEDAEWPGYDMISSVVINNGNSQTMTHNNVVVDLVNTAADSVTSHTVTFTNTYTQQVGKVSMEKTFWERNHDHLIEGNETPDMEALDDDLYKNIEVTITLQGPVTRAIVLNAANSWSGSLDNLPVGEYTILENVENAAAIKIDDHDFVHLHVTVDGQELKGNKITIGKNSNIALKLENHYSHHMGDITVVKQLVGIEDDAIPAGTTFTVNVYPTKNGLKDGTNPVTTITVAKLTNGEWRGTSKDIPVGEYWLEEAAPDAIPGYDFTSGVFDVQLVKVDKETTTTLVNLTNTYQQQMGTLTVTKAFGTDEESQAAKAWLEENNKEIHVLVMDAVHGHHEVARLKLAGTDWTASDWTASDWTASVALPLGTYHLSEVMAVGAEGTADVLNYGLVEHWDSNVVEITADNFTKTFNRTVTNTYTRDRGHVQIQKVNEGVPGNLVPDSIVAFHFFKQTNGSYGATPDAIVTLPDTTQAQGQKWQKTIDLPTGTYLVKEFGAAELFENYTFDGMDWNNKDAVVGNVAPASDGYVLNVQENGTIKLIAKNHYTKDTGSLTIKKEFSGLPEGQYPTIQVNVAKDGVHFDTVTLNEANNWTETLTDLDVGVTYTLSEDLEQAQVEGYNLSHSWVNASVVLEKDESVTSTVTNTYTRKTGKLSLHKRFDGMQADEMALLDDLMVTVTITGNGENRSVVLNSAGNWASEEIVLPVGTYTLSEQPVNINGYTHSEVTYAGANVNNAGAGNNTATVTVTDNAKVEVHLTNTMTRNTGDLTITKAFADDSDLKADDFAGKFIDVLVKRGGEIYTTVTLNQANNWSVTLEDVPTDTYTVEEVTENNAVNSAEVEDYALEVIYSGDGTVASDATSTLTVTNKYTQDVGYIMVKKVFAKDTESLAAEKLIPDTGIAIRVLNSEGQQVALLHVSRTKAVTDPIALPVGTYTLQEVKTAGAEGSAYVDGYTLQSSWSVDNGEITVAKGEVANAATYTLTNQYTRNKGKLTVEKVYIGLEDTDKPEITVYVKQGETSVETLTLNAANNWTAEVELPTGNYTVVEDEGKAAVTNYGLNVSYDKQEVNLTSNGDAVKITNTYSEHVGNLIITKVFEGLPETLRPENIQFTVQKTGDEPHYVTLPVEQNGNKVWTAKLENLPVGEYTVTENAQSAQVPGYTVTVPNAQTVNVMESADVEATVTNTYTYIPVAGSLNLTKEFQGPQYLYPTSVEFTVTGPAYSQKVTLSAENNWNVTLDGLLPGEYIVTENLNDGYSYSVKSIWSNEEGKVQVQAGQTSTLKCTNVYAERPTVSVRIPVEKTVMLAGSTAPDQVFYFSFKTAWQGGSVAMRIENDPSNTAGSFQKTSANTYGVTVRGDGVVKGYIVLEGYMEDLLNGKLQTWEMLSGYATAEEALAAGWTFDKTATDVGVVWNIQLVQDGHGGIKANIARADSQPTDQVSFLNVHTAPFNPPQTGDEENVLLWTALCAISALSVLVLVRSKGKRSSFQVK